MRFEVFLAADAGPDGEFLQPIDQHKEEQPDDVHKVPIPGDGFKAEVIIGGEMSGHAPPQNANQADGSDGDMQAVNIRSA